MIKLEPVRVDEEGARQHLELFAQAFPNGASFSKDYLQWLYSDNPDGLIVGFNAYEGGEIVATYVCTPARVMRAGKQERALLSLNTATRPSHQGKGLFTKLAQATYEYAREQSFVVVFGVANQNSIHGFSKRLGFQDVCGLNARIGIGRFPKGDTAAVRERSTFHRDWSPEALRWRMSNPKNLLAVKGDNSGGAWIVGRTQYPGITVQAALFQEMPAGFLSPTGAVPTSIASVSLGLEPAGTSTQGLSVAIPVRLRPSPLRLIYRNLHDPDDRIDPASILFRFIDFDPY